MPSTETQSISLFADLNAADLAHVESLCTKVTIPAGRKLATEGSRGREAFVIIEGAATVERGGSVVGDLGAGDIVGEIAALKGRGTAQTATVTTTADSLTLVFSAEEFQQILDDHPEVTARVAETALARLEADQQR